MEERRRETQRGEDFLSPPFSHLLSRKAATVRKKEGRNERKKQESFLYVIAT